MFTEFVLALIFFEKNPNVGPTGMPAQPKTFTKKNPESRPP